MRKLVSVLTAFAAMSLASPQGADAAEPAVTVGEVSAEAAQRDDVDLGALREMAEGAVKSLDDGHLPRGTHAVLSVSVVRLESRAGGSAKVSCVVSATLAIARAARSSPSSRARPAARTIPAACACSSAPRWAPPCAAPSRGCPRR